MRLRLLGFAALVAAITTAAWLHERAKPYAFHYENVLGTSMEVTVIASSEADAHRGAAAVLSRIDHDARILSGYDPASEFSRWFATRGQAVHVSAELYDVLGLFDTWRDRSGGALDASAETVSCV